MTMKRCIYILIVVVACVGLTGCRGVRSEKPPIHPNVNMDYQPRFDKQELPMDLPDGVVPYSYVTTAPTDASRSQIMKSGKPAGYYTGESRGQYVRRAPIQVTDAVLETGRERYNIYCSVCHDQTGSGNGTVVQRGYLRPPHLADERLIESPDGYIYDVIANGVRNMPAYGNKISEADRWAIVMYVRALQRLDGVPMSEVPAEYRDRLK